MKHLIVGALAVVALCGTGVFAQDAKKTTKDHASKTQTPERARRQIASDLHWRGSNIPPAVSTNGKWSR